MNYAQYQCKIVRSLGVALDGWPLGGRVCNLGDIGSNEAAILNRALIHGMCKWVILEPEELSASQCDSQHHANNGEGNNDNIEMEDIA